MRIPTGVLLVAICCFFCTRNSFGVPHSAQAQLSTPRSHQTEEKSENTLTLDVVVTDDTGKPVSGLTQADFSVSDNRSASPILGFTAVTEKEQSLDPQQAIFVLDEANMDFTYVGQAKGQLSAFLRRGGGALPLPVSVVLFTDSQFLFSGSPSRDGQTLATDLDKTASGLRTIRRSSGFYGAAERTELSLQALQSFLNAESKVPGRKLLIWIGPGWPYLAYPGTTYSDRDEHTIFNSVTAIWAALRDSQTFLYSVDPLGVENAERFQTTYYRSALKPARRWSEATLSNLGLQVLAEQSGGLVLNSSNDVSRELSQCLQDASAYYTITIPMATSEKPGVFHALSVKLNKRGLRVRTRAGYYTK